MTHADNNISEYNGRLLSVNRIYQFTSDASIGYWQLRVVVVVTVVIVVC